MQVLRAVMVVVAGAVLTQAEAVVDSVDVVPEEVVAAEQPPAPAARAIKTQATGRTFSEWGRQIMEWMGFEDEYDYDYDYDYTYYYPQSASAQVGYGIPAVGYVAPSAGSEHSSYSSYTPIHVAPVRHFHHPARDDKYQEDEWSVSDMMFNVAATVVPIGLLLSALPTGLFTFAVRRRSLDDVNLLQENIDPSELPLLKALMESDLLAFTSRGCQEKLFCELTRIGEHEHASVMQKAFYYVATLTPDYLARKVGLAQLFRMSRSGNCDALRCSAMSAPRVPVTAVPQGADANRIAEVKSNPEKEGEMATKE